MHRTEAPNTGSPLTTTGQVDDQRAAQSSSPRSEISAPSPISAISAISATSAISAFPDLSMATLRVPPPQTSKSEIYGSPVNTRRGLEGILTRYELAPDLEARKSLTTSILLIGVGEGRAAIQLALENPQARIDAINKEAGLMNRSAMYEFAEKKGFTRERILLAFQRIHEQVADYDTPSGRRPSYGREYDLVIFEPLVLAYFSDKVRAVEDLYNSALRTGGILAFQIGPMWGIGIAQPHLMNELLQGFRNTAEPPSPSSHSLMKEGGNFKIYKIFPDSITIPLELVRAVKKPFGKTHMQDSYYQQANVKSR